MKFVTLDFGSGIVWVVEGSGFNPLAKRIILSVLRDGLLEKLWGEGNFRATGIFFIIKFLV